MDNEDKQNREHQLRERIVSLIRSNQRATKPSITKEELHTLQTAATHLDQILQSAANANEQALQSAAARLDQLLADIRTGKDVAQNLKRSQARKGSRE